MTDRRIFHALLLEYIFRTYCVAISYPNVYTIIDTISDREYPDCMVGQKEIPVVS